MPIIEKFGATGVFDPATYSQGIKVHQAQTILFLSGQVAYNADGSPAFRGDFKGQARGAYEAIKALLELVDLTGIVPVRGAERRRGAPGHGHVQHRPSVGEGVGGPDRDRTGDLLNAIQARSQLRYRPFLTSRTRNFITLGRP